MDKVILQQDFPVISGDKTVIDGQKEEIMESHEFASGGKVLKAEEPVSNEVIFS